MNLSQSFTLLFTLILSGWLLGLGVRIYLNSRLQNPKILDSNSEKSISNSSFRILTVGGLCGELIAVRWVGHYMLSLHSSLRVLFPNAHVRNHQPGLRSTSRVAAERLAEEVLNGPNEVDPIVLIGHAKGGLDILELMINHPATIGRIRLAVLMNTPFNGSWVADQLVAKVLSRLRIRWRALEELTSASRQKFWMERWNAIPEWQRRLIVKRIHVVTSEEFVSNQCAFPIMLSHRKMRLEGLRTDGMTELSKQAFPAQTNSPDTAVAGASPLTTHYFWHHGYLTCRALLSNISELERRETLRSVFAQHLAALREPTLEKHFHSKNNKMSHIASRRRYGHLEVIK